MSKGTRQLCEASANGDLARVKGLLRSDGVNGNEAYNGWTPMYVAAQNGHADVLKALIASGCDANAARKGGGMPALIAAEKGHADALEALVAAGADVDHANDEGWTAVRSFFLVEGGQPPLLRLPVGAVRGAERPDRGPRRAPQERLRRRPPGERRLDVRSSPPGCARLSRTAL